MKQMAQQMQKRFEEMQATGLLFRSSITGSELWNAYLASFPEGTNPVFRDPSSSYHNCNNCHNFIRRYGNIVAIDDELQVMSIFDEVTDLEMQDVARVLSILLRGADIQDVFYETFDALKSLPYESCSRKNERFQLGVSSNVKCYTQDEADKFGVVKANETRVWEHMHLFVDKAFVLMNEVSIEAVQGRMRDAYNVFKRGLNEIPLDTLELVRDLITQGSLLNGDAHLSKVQAMIEKKRVFDQIPPALRDRWCWVESRGFPMAKFRNELIGVLCVELSEGMELNAACRAWNVRVDPANYMKAKAPITKQMIENAREFCEENGYTSAFKRRLATLRDIKVSEILHLNPGDGSVKDISIFDGVKAASRKKLRINTERGPLSVEQLWDLDLQVLDELAVNLEAAVEKSAAKSFLTERSAKNIEAQLAFDVVLDILQTKVIDRDRALAAAETRKKRQRIAELIARKQEEDLEGKSIEELEALLEE